jgi:hypothetical protein
MAPLKNNFSWSHTRAKAFDECLRLYYWRHYGSWEGWRAVAPASARLAYRLKHLKTFPMWAGEIVHRVIEGHLRAMRAGQRPVPAEERQQALNWLNQGWTQSTRKEWTRDPKNAVNLFEHYYGHGASKEERSGLREHVFACIDRFFESEAFACLNEAGPARWLTIESLESFDVMSFPVWVKLDFAFHSGEDVVIADWKTGKPGEDDARQVNTYALYAMAKWQTSPERIEARDVYLRDGSEVAVRPDPASLIDHREAIMASMRDMRARLRDPETNEAALDDFPMTGSPSRCPRCAFRQLCEEKSG